MLLSHHQAARLGALLFLLLALPAGAVHAQFRASLDSASIAPGLKVDARHAGASRAVVDSADARSAAAMTFSELMQARAASVSVMMSSGTLTDGGRFLIRGPSTVTTAGAPLLVVDGVRMDDREDDSLAVGSRLDDVAVDDIATVEVLRGPAAAAMYGAGASSGVIVVTTKRGAPGPWRVSGRVLSDVRRDASRIPDDFRRAGTDARSGAAMLRCSLDDQVRGACVPGALTQWNPVRDAGALGTGAGALVSGSLSGGWSAGALRLSATGRQSTGVGRGERLTGINSRLNVSQRLRGGFDLTGHASFVRNATTQSPAGEAIEHALGRGGFGDAAAYARYLDSLYQRPLDGGLAHATGGAELAYRRGSWLTLALAATADRAETSADRTTNFSSVSYQERDLGSGRRDAVRGTAQVRHSLAGAQGTLFAGVEHLRERRHQLDSTRSTFGVDLDSRYIQDALGRGLVGYSERDWRSSDVAMFVGERLALGQRLAVGAGLRRETPAMYGPDTYLLPSADVAWTLPVAPGASLVRARVAYGESLQPSFSARPFPRFLDAYYNIGNQAPPAFASPEGPERMREFEGGVDVEWGARASLGLTAYRRAVHDVAGARLPLPFGNVSESPRATIDSHGIEVDARARVIDVAGVRWELRAVGATQSNRIDGDITFGVSGIVPMESHPVASSTGRAGTYSDASGDGIIARAEFSPSGTGSILSSTPTFEGALHSLVTIGSRLGIGAIVDRRSGFSVYPTAEASQCTYELCRAMQDPTATLDEQGAARALAFRAHAMEAGFTRLRELSFRWTLSPRAPGAGGMTLVVAGRDQYTWTGWAGLDPEINTAPRDVLTRSDRRGVALPRRLMIGLELGAR